MANKAAENLFAVHLKELIGKSIEKAIPLYTDKQELVKKKDHPALIALQTQEKVCVSDFSVFVEMKRMLLEISAAPILLNGQVFGTILILTDITKAKEIDRMKTEFISIASHQLRGPLASLKWYGDWFAKGKAGKLLKMQKEFIAKMNASTTTMISLVDDFLNVSRIEQGKIKNEPTDVSVLDLVKNILELSEHEIQEKSIHISTVNLAHVSVVKVDPDMIREIVSNFISNAIKYTREEGEIWIRLTSDIHTYHVEIENTGYGIPTQEQSKIFSKFFRASNIVKQGVKGTGLGLYTTKRLAESFGGSVGFASIENETTKFWVIIPLS